MRNALALRKATARVGGAVARHRDGVSSLLNFRRRSCSMGIAQFAGGSRLPVAYMNAARIARVK